jgi:hypothetical protein
MNFGAGVLSLMQSTANTLVISNSVLESTGTFWGDHTNMRDCVVRIYGGPEKPGRFAFNTINFGGVRQSYAVENTHVLSATQINVYNTDNVYAFENSLVKASNAAGTSGTILLYGTGNRLLFTNCVVETASGITLGSTANSGNLRFGFFGASTNAARLKTTNFQFNAFGDNVTFTLDGGYVNPTTSLAMDCRPGGPVGNTFAITGPSSLVETPLLRVSSNACVRFEIPADGYDTTPVQPGNAYFDTASRITITTKAFSGRQRLVEAQGGGLFFGDPANNIPFAHDSFTIPNAAYPQFEADIPRNCVASVILTPVSMEVKIYPTPTLFMVR